MNWPRRSWRGGRRPRIRQHDASDCGAACLAAITEKFGVRVPISRIRQLCSTDRQGTTLLGLMEGARALGLEARGVRAQWNALAKLPLPAIAHVILEDCPHFVVIYGCDEETVIVMDPRQGTVRRWSRAEFDAVWTGALLVVTPTGRLRDLSGCHRPPGARLWSLIQPHRAVLLQTLAGAAVFTLIGLATAVFVRHLVDSVLPSGNRNLLDLLGLGMLAVIVGQAGLGALKDLFILRTGQRIDGGLIDAYCRHVLHLPQSFFDHMRVGEIVSRVGDAVKIRAFVNDVAVSLVVSCFVVAFSFALMLAYSPRLATTMLVVLPVYAILFWVTNRAHRRTQRATMERAARFEAELVESIGAVGTIKRFGAELMVAERIERRLVDLLRTIYDSATWSILSRTLSDLLYRLAVVAALWIGTGLVIGQQLTAGELMSVYALLGFLGPSLVSLMGATQLSQDALIATDRLFEILDLEPENPRSSGARLEQGTPPVVRFSEVCFGYGARGLALRDVDLTAEPGQLTCIVGHSGSGKTTLSALLQGIHQPTSGRLFVGGIDTREMQLSMLRREIASVPQTVELLSGSVVENIVLGESEPDVAKVIRICARLGLDEVIQRLPQGLLTLVGERGVGLSGGESQRIALARALYREPRILVLDEATSALDAVAEERVMSVLESFAKGGNTVLMITHRLALSTAADTIYVMEAGRIVQRGTHRELVSRPGKYLELWERQHGEEPGGRPRSRSGEILLP